jgi:hypothetical protein
MIPGSTRHILGTFVWHIHSERKVWRAYLYDKIIEREKYCVR